MIVSSFFMRELFNFSHQLCFGAYLDVTVEHLSLQFTQQLKSLVHHCRTPVLLELISYLLSLSCACVLWIKWAVSQRRVPVPVRHAWLLFAGSRERRSLAGPVQHLHVPPVTFSCTREQRVRNTNVTWATVTMRKWDFVGKVRPAQCK